MYNIRNSVLNITRAAIVSAESWKTDAGPAVAVTRAWVTVSAGSARLCSNINGVFTRSSKHPANFQQMYSKYKC